VSDCLLRSLRIALKPPTSSLLVEEKRLLLLQERTYTFVPVAMHTLQHV
jgi:hypothetical protein